MFDSIKQLWDICTKLVYAAALFLLFIGGVELLRIYAFFHRMHPVAAYLYLAALLASLIALVVYFKRTLGKLPRVLKPPKLGNLEEASFKSMVKFCRFQKAYLQRLGNNPRLGEEAYEHSLIYIERIDSVLGAHPLLDDLQRLILEIDEQGITPLLDTLKAEANTEVRACVRDIMLTVTISPYRMLDMLVVMYRNGNMILRVAQIFDSRPTLRGQLRIINDTLKIVATVNILNLSRNLMESIFSRMPLVGRVVEDIGQGIGAGFFTDLAGHAAIARCSAYHGWNHEEALEGLGSQSKQFLEDVRDIFLRDVLPLLKGRVRTTEDQLNAEGIPESSILEKLGGAVSGAFDATGYTLNEYMVKPAVAGTQSVFRAGTRIVRGPETTSESASLPPPNNEVRRRRRSSPKRRKGLSRILNNIGQRIKYGSLRTGR